MSIQVQMEQMSGYLVARFTGAGAAEDVWRQFELIAEHCKSTNKNKLLLDFTEARIEMSLVERYFVGTQTRIFVRYGLKVAGVGRPGQLDPKKFAEMVAQNRWVNLCGFTNVKAAEEWLLT